MRLLLTDRDGSVLCESSDLPVRPAPRSIVKWNDEFGIGLADTFDCVMVDDDGFALMIAVGDG